VSSYILSHHSANGAFTILSLHRILAAVREGRGEDAARHLEGMKKDDMAKTAEGLLAGSGWLPEPLRTPGRPFASAAPSDPTIDAAAPEATSESSGVESQPTEAGDGEHNDDRADGDDDASFDIRVDTRCLHGIDFGYGASRPIGLMALIASSVYSMTPFQ